MIESEVVMIVEMMMGVELVEQVMVQVGELRYRLSD